MKCVAATKFVAVSVAVATTCLLCAELYELPYLFTLRGDALLEFSLKFVRNHNVIVISFSLLVFVFVVIVITFLLLFVLFLCIFCLFKSLWKFC